MKIKNRIGPGLVIGLPTLGRPVSLDWAMAFKALNPPINFNSVFSLIRNQEVADARNFIAESALQQGAKYLFFIGDDVIVPPHTLRQLIFRMEQDDSIGVVGGVYCAKCDPSFPLVFRDNGQGSYWDWKIGEFFQCYALGMDCTLIRVKCFEGIQGPLFKTVDEDQFLDGINKAEQWTEDLYFFNKLKETNWKVYCDASVICEHEDIYGGKRYTLPVGSLPLRVKVREFEKSCLIIGPKIELDTDEFDVVQFGPEDADYRGQFNNLPFNAEQFDWVIVSDPQIIPPSIQNLDEWERVLKPGGKLSINFVHWINRDHLTKHYNAIENGSFVELIKDVRTNPKQLLNNSIR